VAIDIPTLFAQLGKLAKVLGTADVYAGATLPAAFAEVQTALAAYPDLLSPLPAALTQAQAQATAVGQLVRSQMVATLTKVVNADSPQADRNSVPLALAELRRQMVAASKTVPACAVSVTPAAVSGNSGTGNVVGTVLRGDGQSQQNVFAETGDLTCLADARGGGATAGGEPWQYRGDYATPDVMGQDWPGYSGASAGLTTIDSQSAGANLLRNGGFETYTVADVPDFWTMTGTPGTHFASEASVVHRGAKAFKVIGDGATNVAMAQTITAARPNRVYAFNVWLRLSAATAAGQILVNAFDGTNPIQDDTTGGHSVAIDLTALATPTVYTPFSLIFVTPRVLPATVQVRLRLTTPLAAGRTLYLDSAAAGEVSFLYPGGPALAVFAGATPWAAGDRFTVAVTNDRAGATYGRTWNAAFDRFFSARQLGFLLPVSGSPNVLDSLMT
jgi:hypothetical protein